MKLDPQLSFFLSNRDVIETWYQLRERLPEAAHRFFASLAVPMVELASELGPDVHLDALQKANSVRLILYREPWYDKPGRALRIGVGMGWQRGDFQTAFAGIWINRNHSGLSTLEPVIRQEVLRLGLPDFNTRGDDWWPAWRYLEPAQDAYWEHLDRFSEQILDTLDHAWHAFAPAIDLALDVAAATARSREVATDAAH